MQQTILDRPRSSTSYHHRGSRARDAACDVAVALATAALFGACNVSDADLAETDDTTAEVRHDPPTPGAAGIGDVLYPTLGNGGYDVLHYDLDLRYATAAPDQPLDATVTIVAHATQALSRFDLDFAGDSVGAVTVNFHRATAVRDGEELVIRPAAPIGRGDLFVVRIEHATATPGVPSPDDFLGAPFFIHADGSAWAGQPNGSHRIFPCNDHPRDKASFTFRIDVPAGTTAVANGVLDSSITRNGRTIWRYSQWEPMPTELAQVAVGALTVIERGQHSGVRVRDVVPARLADQLGPKLAIEVDQIAWLESQIGEYPFRSYGTLATDASFGFALETQTLSLFETSFFDADPAQYAPIMVHELAHQWFGNSVAPAAWSDVWLNEGHATWYEVLSQIDIDDPAIIEQVRQLYGLGDLFRQLFGPVAGPKSGDPVDVFNPNVYGGGALVLFALRQQVGDETFRAIEREWVRAYRGRSASSADFVATASRVSGQDLTAFLTAWLYDTHTPAMPGHPDWTVDPAPSLAAALPASPLFRHWKH